MIHLERDTDGDWPDWVYDAAGRRLENVGGTTQWRDPSYRMAYVAVVLRALEKAYLERVDAE